MKLGFFGLIAAALVVAKLLGYGTYTWLVALSPLLIGAGIWFAVITGIVILAYVRSRK